jgi:fatty-acyl-CoA synthase
VSLTIGGILDSCLAASPTACAATLADDAVSFAELEDNANRLARVLLSRGVGPRDVVAWWSGPSLRTLEGFVACARIGAVFAPFNPALSESEAQGTLEYLQPAILISDHDHAEVAATLAAAIGCRTGAFGEYTRPDAELDAAIAESAGHPLRMQVDDSWAHIVYLTSGSTGQPKGALVSHRASWLRSSAGGGTFAQGLRGPGGVITGFPLFHYGGWSFVMEAWQNRRPIHLIRRADAVHLMAAIERWRPCALYAIPAVWERILATPEDAYDLSSLRHADTGTSFVSADLAARIRSRLPATTTTILYGSSEGGRMAALTGTDVPTHPGSVGVAAFPGVLTLSGTGEVLFRSPGLMDGYLHRPEETAAVIQNGVYRTGDVGRLDAEGYLYLTGRTSEAIRTGGETVWPTEVEVALRDLPGVADLAVVGVPDEQWGEIICAAIVPEGDGTTLDAIAIRSHLTGRLARYKHPRLVVGVAAIPRTSATGQVRRLALREMIIGGQTC